MRRAPHRAALHPAQCHSAQKTALICLLLGILGSCSDALVDYYTIGAPAWNISPAGLVMGLVLYCLSLIFEYGCGLQQLSDETL